MKTPLKRGGRPPGKTSKKARREGRTIVFVDETGVYLLPSIVKTWAPKGQTPILSNPLSRDHWSLIGAITPSDKLYCLMYPHSIKGDQVVQFLRHLLRHVVGKLLVIWEGLSAHHAHSVKDFLSAGGTARIHLQRLPSYTPDLNPQEEFDAISSELNWQTYAVPTDRATSRTTQSHGTTTP